MNAAGALPSLLSTGDCDPFPYLETLREQGEVVWDEGLNGWLVLSYELCRQVLMDEATFQHNYVNIDAVTKEVKGGDNIVVVQGETHDRLHRYIVQLFSPKNMKLYTEHHIVPVTDRLIDAFAARGSADLRGEFATQLPARTIMSLFGMSAGDNAAIQRVVDLHEIIMKYLGKVRHTPAETAEAIATSHELNDLLRPYIRQRQHDLGTDLVSRLWAEAPALLDNFNEDLMLANCRELYLAGSDTTVHALSNALYLLLANPALRSAVDADRQQALTAFIDETIRLLGVIQHRFRIAARDVDLGGVRVRAGDSVIPVLLAANRDPKRYERPADPDITRAKVRDHLGFIVGPRNCPGAPLARAEMRVAIERLLDRLPDVRLDETAPPPRFLGLGVRSYAPLPVIFTAAR